MSPGVRPRPTSRIPTTGRGSARSRPPESPPRAGRHGLVSLRRGSSAVDRGLPAAGARHAARSRAGSRHRRVPGGDRRTSRPAIAARAGERHQALRIAGSVRRFPTLDPAAPGVVVDLPTYVAANFTRFGAVIEPSQWWLETPDERDVVAQLRAAPFSSLAATSRGARARAAGRSDPARGDRRAHARLRRRGVLRRRRVRRGGDGGRPHAAARVRRPPLARPADAPALRLDQHRERARGRAEPAGWNCARPRSGLARAALRRARDLGRAAGSARDRLGAVGSRAPARAHAARCARPRRRLPDCSHPQPAAGAGAPG